MYDILMLLVLGGAIFLGMWKGLAWQVASLLSVVLSYFVSSNFWPMLAPMIKVDPPLNEFIAMFALFLATALAVWIVFGFIRKSIEKMSLKNWDRQAGAIVGAFKGALLCILVTMFAVTLLGDNNKRAIINSTSGRLITSAINKIAVAVPSNMREKIDSYIDKYNETVDEHHDPNQSGSPIGETLSEYVNSAFDKLKQLQANQNDTSLPNESNDTSLGQTASSFPGTIPPLGTQLGSQLGTQPTTQLGNQFRASLNSPAETQFGGSQPSPRVALQPGLGSSPAGQGTTIVGRVTAGEASRTSNEYYFDSQTGKWIELGRQNSALPTESSPNVAPNNSENQLNWNGAANTVRNQITEAVTDNFRRTVQDRLNGQ